MKRKRMWFAAIAVLLLIVAVALCCFGRVILRDVVKAEIVCEDQRKALSRADREWVVELLDGKWYAESDRSCGTSDCCLELTQKNGTTATFYAAFDDCPCVWHAECNRYMLLSEDECDAFRALLDIAAP